jgi:anti-sigma regulatory factor (Ser/Thr protein kinase)
MSAAGSDHQRLEIRSDPSALGAVRERIEAFALAHGLDEEAAGRMVLAVDEALTNVIRHAYHGATDQPIEIDLAREGDELVVTVRDHGRVVHPEAIRSRDLDDIRPGGLGVHIMNECMTQVEFAPADGGGTVLTMRKRLGEPCDTNEPQTPSADPARKKRYE